jgi:hypothetical protein
LWDRSERSASGRCLGCRTTATVDLS